MLAAYLFNNEVKINNKWYNIDLTRILLTKGEPFKPYNHITNQFYNTEFGLEEEFPSLTISPEEAYKDMFYYTSKIYNPKENLEKNEAYIYIWSGKNIYDCYESFINKK